MYKSYHYDNMPRPITTPRQTEAQKPKVQLKHDTDKSDKNGFLNGFLGDLKNDDIILLVVIFILLIDDCDDKLLLIALGIIFFSGLGE